MTSKDLYSKGSQVWVSHPTLVWEPAEITSDYNNNELEIEFEDGRKKIIKIESENSLPPLRNPEILIGENDLTALSYLHEPAVLHNLKYRFCSLYTIYTYCGIVLVAINPYDELQIYDNDTILTYRGKSQGDLDPHIFAVAEEAYAKLEREGKNQSIIVSGESGAGKTVSAKYAMRYFATVGGSSEETQVEKKVLSSSPIMEAIGNAKTTRNDNSSRFGKFIEIRFNKNFHIVGASMRTYLLEKSRVVFQAPSERNYHIFYQLCSARDKLPYLHLDHEDKFLYLNQGKSSTIEGVNDYNLFEETLQALNILGFNRSDQENMFKILAAILHLGNVDDPHLKIFCNLLELNSDQMRQWLCQRKITSMREVFNKPMSIHESTSAKEALSKHMYAQLFDWIVTVINNALENSRDKTDHKIIGVLDIYGFETFEINSFEQFCINYANEKLQQQFNQHVFKLEQEEYLKEEIEWKFIDFYDNQPCIDLIESKLGVLDLLDEECRMPKGSDFSWAEKLYKACIKYKHFSKPRFGASSFIVQHFADSVEYQVDGFLDKNRDSVIEEQINVLKMSRNESVKKLFGKDENETPQGRVKITPSKPVMEKSKHKKTVGSQFRDNLNLLMTTLNATTPHYVRCIKPNDFKKAFDYNPQRAVQQLRACGVLETVRISAAGFPSRWLYNDFFARYRVLCKFKDINRSDMKATCSKILLNYITEPDKYQFGKTKIFFRAGQVAFLEKLRAEKLKEYCIIIQKQIRAFIQRKKYLRIKHCIFHLQRYIRGYLARKHALFLKQTKAATTMQRYVRGWIARNQYVYLRNIIIGIQTHIKGYIARKKYKEMYYNKKAIIIQRHVRGFLARKKYKKDLNRIIICQNAVRRFFAKKKLKELKKEARSVEHVKKLNKGLENKIISLQQKIGELAKENNVLKTFQNECNELRVKLDALKNVENEMKKAMNHLNEKEKIINNLNEKIIQEQNEKMDALEDANKIKETLNKFMDQNKNLKAELDSINEKIKKNQFGVEENIKARIEQEKTILIHEHEQDLENYQKLLKEYSSLEQKNEHLENLIEKLTSGHSRSPSEASSLHSSRTSTEVENDDFGYSSNKSTISRKDDFDTLEKDRSISEYNTMRLNNQTKEVPDIDVGLVLKLQQKLKDVENERDKLFLKVESLEKEDSPTEERQRTMDSIRLENLEIENEKLKSDLTVLRESLAMGDPGTKELLNQFRASEKELDRRRDEIVQLRTVLATQTKGLKNIAKINYGSSNDVNLDVINEDGELIMAFETQKGIIRSPQSQTEGYMQHEISRLTAENLDLQEKFDLMQENTRKLKKQNKALLKKLKELDQVESQDQNAISKPDNKKYKVTDEGNNTLPNVMMKKERNYQGMFEYRSEDEALIVKHLKPRVAMYLLPGLPAYIFFMCIRHTDFVNDDGKVRSLLTAFINAVKKLIKKKHDDLETTVLWLSNTLRLLHNLKQYSGDKIFQQDNTPKQNEQCLRNFDLKEYRQVLSDMAVWIYQGAVRDLQEKINSLIVPAILEHEAISGFSKGLAGRQRASSVSNATENTSNPQVKLDALIGELTGFHRIFAIFGVDPEVISQIFRQTFYFICACSLNNLLCRKDLCNWTKGMQIRYNLSNLEEWAKQHLLKDSSITETLQPIIQASHLLQARKEEEDIKSLCDMCDKLPEPRIVKLLHLYTPADDYEKKVPVSYLRKIQAELKSRSTGDQPDSPLLMDTKFVFPVRFPFNPSNIRLEDIEIPGDLDLPMLKKV
ncbi:myosin-5A, putative [Pediculus humanus corporis]|uniref:Myosin-5A, putative n=1 Tax=Pediculus humanus subsp. corporis TaxID=121224 RepID=E0VAZ3_PEDHC|nr:myosin-5A, putative [Pediculus humanus corporis]EEB10549.1 myosin-5A, putative [Pediculus humanus corporis]